jgi:hypothetical protein
MRFKASQGVWAVRAKTVKENPNNTRPAVLIRCTLLPYFSAFAGAGAAAGGGAGAEGGEEEG